MGLKSGSQIVTHLIGILETIKETYCHQMYHLLVDNTIKYYIIMITYSFNLNLLLMMFTDSLLVHSHLATMFFFVYYCIK